ncbi:MAG: phosphoribosylformylglycinamidine synthase subunit PurS [Actinomycetota bacterium]
MRRRYEVVVSLRSGLLDPQGKAVEESLPTMGFAGVEDVRVGKHIELTIEADDEAAALDSVRRIAEQVLSNPVIEEYRILESEATGR